MRSKSRWPDWVMRRPPLSSSISTTPIFSSAWRTLRSTEPEASTWCEGREPRFLVELHQSATIRLRRRGGRALAMGFAELGVRTRGPCGDGQHRRSCACRRGGRRQRRGRRTSRCPGEAARWSLFLSAVASRYFKFTQDLYLRDVLTVSTQPVDKTVSKLIVQLSPSDGIQVLSFTRWNSTNLGFTLLALRALELDCGMTYMGSFPCLFKKAAYEVMNFCASTSLTVTPPIFSVLLGKEGLVG